MYETLEKIHQGDKEAREQMILDNMGLVVSMVRRFAYTQLDREELIQIGTIGLMKAIDNFNTKYEVCFSTYAVPMICGEIKRFLRHHERHHDQQHTNHDGCDAVEQAVAGEHGEPHPEECDRQTDEGREVLE